MEDNSFRKILISRTDNIGDVILTLPMAGAIKQKYPNSKVIFLGKKYTKPIIDTCVNIDEFYDWDEIKKSDNRIQLFKNMDCDTIIHVFPNKEIAKIAKQASIKNRIGTSRRLYHWIYCNNKVVLSRKKSNLHESQLNLKLLEPLSINNILSIHEIPKYYGLTKIKNLPENYTNLIDPNRFNLILHPKSKGSAREWGVDNFVTLANSLPDKHFKIFFSGGSDESDFIKKNILSKCPLAHDITGLFSLSEFISFINSCDGLIANSTGPLHIASALGINTLGLYPPIKPMSPKRWAPIGYHSQYLLGKNINTEEYCNSYCEIQKKCSCMENLNPLILKQIIEKWGKVHNS
jgi:heptosyltransferase III